MSPIAASWLLKIPNPPLALRNVVHGGRRSLVAIAGVAFAVTMVLLQLGFYEAVRITATNLYDQFDFDIVLLAPTYDQFYAPGRIPLRAAPAGPVAGDRSCARRAALFDLQPLAMSALSAGRPGRRLGRRAPEPGPLRRWLAGRPAAPAAPAPRAAGARRRPR